MSLHLVTAPATEPVTTAEAKAYARVDISDDDTLIGTLITGARDIVENEIRRQLITATWMAIYDRCDIPKDGNLDLPRAPLQSVSSVQYLDLDDAWQTVSSGEYVVDTNRNPGRLSLYPRAAATLPSVCWKALRVTFVCGYGNAAAVPESLKTAIKMIVSYQYDAGRPGVAGSEGGGSDAKELPMALRSILNRYYLPEAA